MLRRAGLAPLKIPHDKEQIAITAAVVIIGLMAMVALLVLLARAS
jgi:hypothetical protein